MSALQFLRQSKHIARWVLVWFALSLTAAVAAPVVNPQNLMLVCTAAGQVKLVDAASKADTALQGTGLAATSLHAHLDCVLCLALDVPSTQEVMLPALLPTASAQPSVWADPWVSRLRAHNSSARGPPAVALTPSV